MRLPIVAILALATVGCAFAAHGAQGSQLVPVFVVPCTALPAHRPAAADAQAAILEAQAAELEAEITRLTGLYVQKHGLRDASDESLIELHQRLVRSPLSRSRVPFALTLRFAQSTEAQRNHAGRDKPRCVDQWQSCLRSCEGAVDECYHAHALAADVTGTARAQRLAEREILDGALLARAPPCRSTS